MTYHSIMEEANYAQLMTAMQTVCSLSLESYRDVISDEDSSLDVILETTSKSNKTLLQYVVSALKAVVDHINEAVNDVRIRLQKKKLDKFMSPEMKKHIEEIAAGKKIKSPDAVKIQKIIKESENYAKSYSSRVNKAASALASANSKQAQEKYATQVVKICDEARTKFEDYTKQLMEAYSEKKELTVHDIYRFVDAGINSLDFITNIGNYIKMQETVFTKLINNAQQNADKLRKFAEAVDDEEAKDQAKEVSKRVGTSPAVQKAVNKAINTAQYMGTYSAKASKCAFGIVDGIVSYDLMDMSTRTLASNAVMTFARGKFVPGITLPSTVAKITKTAYLKKKLDDDREAYKRKDEEAKELREQMKKNGAVL